MKLYKEVCPKFNTNPNYPRRYLLLQEVSDEDAKILDFCNMKRDEDYDDKEHNAEAWMVM